MLSVVYEKVCCMSAFMIVVGGVTHEIQEGKLCRWHHAIGSPHSSVVKFHWVVPIVLVFVNLWVC